MENMKEIKAAYALNLWTVSISQIIDYNDVNVMKQEYENIMNNLNIENMPKDEALLDIIKSIMDEITNIQVSEGDLKMLEREYQHKMKNAVWNAVPHVGAIFATSDPVALGLTLATQVGIGYMNYRRNRAEYDLGYDKSKWEIQKNRMYHLNGLQKQLFETAWRLTDAHQISDEYRLTDSQIHAYNTALMESNPTKRFNKLLTMCANFEAYPLFWYQLGSTANSIYRSDLYIDDEEMRCYYKDEAEKAFDKFWLFYEDDEFKLLRTDVLAASCALEYLELLDYNRDKEKESALDLIEKAEKFAGNNNDVLELCAFSYLRVEDYKNAARIFDALVNDGYNEVMNAQILSALYIKQMHSQDEDVSKVSRIKYKALKNITSEEYIIKCPDKDVDLTNWKPDWNKNTSMEEFLEEEQEKNRNKKIQLEEEKKKARAFYQRETIIVYDSKDKDIAEYFLSILNQNRNAIDENLPAPSRVNYKKYKKNRVVYEQKNARIILLGDSDEAKTLHKIANNGEWDYYKYGMRYVSSGEKSVILLRKLDSKEIDELIELAKEMDQKYSLKIPSGVGSIKWDVKDLYSPSGSVVTDVIIKTITFPLAGIITVLDGAFNTIQTIENLLSKEEIRFLRYSIAIYKYLEDKGALYSDCIDNNEE